MARSLINPGDASREGECGGEGGPSYFSGGHEDWYITFILSLISMVLDSFESYNSLQINS